MTTSPTGKPHPFGDLIGLEVDESAPAPGHLRLTIRDEHKNPNGVVHGAVVYALLDTGMGHTVSATLAPGEHCATVEIKISYLRPVMSGSLHSRIQMVRRGKRICFLEGEVFDTDNRLLAKASGTFAIFTAE